MTYAEIIKNYIDRKNGSFSMYEVVKMTDTPDSTVSLCFTKWQKEGYIKLIDKKNRIKIYILSKNSKGNEGFISNKAKIKDYIRNSIEPFTMGEIAIKTGLAYPTVSLYFVMLRKEGYIKHIDTKRNTRIYMVINNNNDIIDYVSTEDKIKNIFNSFIEPFTVKEIANKTDLSTHTVRNYLSKMEEEGYIKVIDIKNIQRFYILCKGNQHVPDHIIIKDKVRNHILNSSEPFTSKMIANEFAISISLANDYLRDMVREGYAHFIGIINHRAKLYVSKNFKGNISDIPTIDNKIRNFIKNSVKPFTAQEIVKECDIPYGKMKKYIRIMHKEGLIKLIYKKKPSNVYISSTYQGDIPELQNAYHRIKNIAYNSDKPFTVTMIQEEYGYSKEHINRNLRELRIKGYIKRINNDGYEYVYTSTKNPKNILMNTTKYDIIKRYIYHSGKPFNAKKLEKELGINYGIVKRTVRLLYNEGYIKLIGIDNWSKIYILNRV